MEQKTCEDKSKSSFLTDVVEIQIKVIELLSPFPDVDIIFKNLKALVSDVADLFQDYYHDHSHKPWVEVSFKCIIAYFLKQINDPFKAFLTGTTVEDIINGNSNNFHIKLLIYVE